MLKPFLRILKSLPKSSNTLVSLPLSKLVPIQIFNLSSPFVYTFSTHSKSEFSKLTDISNGQDHQGVDEDVPKTVTCVTAKEMKAKLKPEFQAHPEKYYPTETFRKLGFTRAHCKCGHYFWRKSEKTTLCGDSNCSGTYSFIGQPQGLAKSLNKTISYKQAWKTFQKSLSTARVPCTPIQRYPVIARWRNDVDYVAAGIFCFQPYCVTGELQPPANPLICPQFVVRFNDLDNIGLTGRHYSGFVMLGIQVFNKPDQYIFWKDECIEFNYRWLTEELKLDPQDITFVEDIWAGGGNLGPSVEYFVGGLELGNMVFMQYKYFNDGGYQELPVKVIDVGIGLQRIPWLLNGSPTSYFDVFSHSFKFLNSKLNISLNTQMWNKLGPYTCRLDIDEAQNIQQTWKQISKLIQQQDVAKVKQAILPVKQLYVILDHTRTALVIIQDGGLPSNIGGGSNCRNIIRRVFAILKKNDWWEKIGGVQGLLQLFECHKQDLAELYGPFAQYKSFEEIIKIEYDRWANTEAGQKKKLQTLIDKNKGKLTLDDWIMVMQSYGIPADAIAQLCKTPIPENLYKEIAERAQKQAKAQQQILYDTIQYQQTQNLYYTDHRLGNFNAKVLAVLKNVTNKEKGHNIVLLDRSAFYPTSGGQVHDLGKIRVKDGEQTYNVLNVEKVGKCFLHFLDKEVEDIEGIIGKEVEGNIDEIRRNTLMAFHTGTHIVFAATRRVLGPHIWQHGAKKTQNGAHLDVTHYSSLNKDLQQQIQNEANKIILQSHPIKKYFQSKSQAQKEFGFRLYQGGIVPGNVIRVVNITDVDVQACCGTHADNTSEVGWIKLVKTTRISDGTLRLYFMAGKKVMAALNQEAKIVNQLKDLWGVEQKEIVGTATRFFNEYKRYQKEAQNQKLALLGMYSRYAAENPHQQQTFVVPSIQKEMTLYFSSMNTHLVPVLTSNRTIIFVTDSFIFGIVSKPEHLDLNALKTLIKEQKSQEETDQLIDKKFILKKGFQYGKGKEKAKNENGVQMNYVGRVKDKKIIDFLVGNKFELLK